MSTKTLASLLFAVVLAIGTPLPAGADAVIRSNAMEATTIAEYFVEDGQITVELEIGGSDLPAFRNLMPDDIHDKIAGEPRPWPERLSEFFERDFAIAVPGAPPLVGRVLEMGPRPRVRRDPITGDPLPTDQGDPDLAVFARLVYPLDGQPEELIFSAPPGASVGFVVYHEGVAVNDFRYLGRNVALKLDWQDPWYSRFHSRSLLRQYFAPMSGFIYVEPYEVRKEVIVRPLDLQQWVDLGLEGRQTIPVELQPELKRRAAEFLRGHQPVEIDGRTITPDLARIHFLERTLRTSRVIDPPEELDVHSAVLGAIFVYPTDGLPERVTMEWDLWSERLDKVPASAVDQAGPLPSFLEPDWRVLEWQNFLKNPELPTLREVVPPPSPLAATALWLRWILLALTLCAVGWAFWPGQTRTSSRSAAVAGLAVATLAGFWLSRDAGVDEARSREVVAAILHNVYRAFDHREEERIYDVLARSASGDLLERIYLETRRGLILTSQGGARAKVKEIELVELTAEAAPGRGFLADVTWNVSGSVGHWGHIHQRRNRVRAELTVAPQDGVWKLVDMQVLSEERL